MFHIENAPVEEEDKGLKIPIQYVLRDSKYRFHLTGSRYFGNTKSGSDWDFFVTWTRDCEAFLLEQGFKQVKKGHYQDQQLVNLLRYTEVVDPGCSALQIDVQMVRDAGLKEKAQAYVFSNPPLLKMYYELSKCQKEALWDLAYSAANGLVYTGALQEFSGRPNKVNLQNILTNFCENPEGRESRIIPAGDFKPKPKVVSDDDATPF